MSFGVGRKKSKETPVLENESQSPLSTTALLERGVLNRETFFLLYSRLIEERLGVRNVRFVEDAGLSFETEDGRTLTTYLENVWRECQQADEPRIDIVERYMASLSATTEEAMPGREQIIAIIKDSEYVALLGKEPAVLIEHLAVDIWVVFAFDLPKSTRALTFSEMERLGVARGELHSLAIENLKRILPDIECHGEGPWFLLTAGGDYVASILLLDGVWQSVSTMVEGDIVVVTPSRDVLLFTGSQSAKGIETIRQKATSIFEDGHHLISKTLLRRIENKWVNFD